MLLIWNILFMAPRIKMIVIKTYFGAVVVKRCVTKICRNRSKRRIVSQQPLQSKFELLMLLMLFCHIYHLAFVILVTLSNNCIGCSISIVTMSVKPVACMYACVRVFVVAYIIVDPVQSQLPRQLLHQSGAV